MNIWPESDRFAISQPTLQPESVQNGASFGQLKLLAGASAKMWENLDSALPIPSDMQLSQMSAPSAPICGPASGPLVPDALVERTSTLVYGAFKAMGDILNASPVIASQLDSGYEVKLLIFPGPALPEFIRLIDFGPNRNNLELVPLPVSLGIKTFLDYFSWAKAMEPGLIWISPHAPRSASSWKIPILLWSTKKMFWKKARLAGASSESLSILFDESVSVDRNLPHMEREQLAFSMLCDSTKTPLRRISFIPRIQDQRKLPPLYDLLIHPGANVPSRMWPVSRYQELVRLLPPLLRIAVVGIPGDIEMMRLALPADRDIAFLTGSLEQAISAIARSRAVLAMDSGAMHFAKILDVPAVALFGKCDPATVIASGGNVLPIYERKFPCQPCGKPGCSQPEAYCINSIEAPTVARSLVSLINQPGEP